MEGRFCPICGRKVEYFIDGLCTECFKKRNPILKLPQKISIVLCRSCFSYKLSGKWYAPSRFSNIEEVILHVAKKELMKYIKKSSNVERVSYSLEREFENQGKYKIIVSVEGKSHKKIPYAYTEEYAVVAEINYVLCPSCIDSRGRVERAIVQVRAKDRNLTVKEYSSVKSVITSVIARAWKENRDIVPLEVKGEKNIDITFSSHAAAKKIASELQKKLPFKRMDTTKITGVSHTGKPQTKLTIRLLLPEFKEGDIVMLSGKLYMVLSYEKDKIRLLSLNNYKEIVLSIKEIFSRAKVKAHYEDIEEVLVVAITPPYVQVMDLKTFGVYEVRAEKIPLWIREGENIGLINIDGRKFFLPLR